MKKSQSVNVNETLYMQSKKPCKPGRTTWVYIQYICITDVCPVPVHREETYGGWKSFCWARAVHTSYHAAVCHHYGH